MLKSQKQGLFDITREHKLEPSLFVVTETPLKDGAVSFMLQLRDSPLLFHATSLPNSWDHHMCEVVAFTPDFKKRPVKPDVYLQTGDMYNAFRVWLDRDVTRYLQEEVLSDPWFGIPSEPPIPGPRFADPSDLLPFDLSEQQSIKDALKRFRNFVTAEFTLEERRLQELDRRLQYLAEAVTRLNRFDWKSLAFSSLVTLSTALSLDTTQGRHLLELFRRAFTHISGLLS